MIKITAKKTVDGLHARNKQETVAAKEQHVYIRMKEKLCA
jgi:hypothetical protein